MRIIPRDLFWLGSGLRWNSLFERAVALAYHTKSNGSPGMLWVLGVLGGGKFDLINTCVMSLWSFVDVE